MILKEWLKACEGKELYDAFELAFMLFYLMVMSSVPFWTLLSLDSIDGAFLFGIEQKNSLMNRSHDVGI